MSKARELSKLPNYVLSTVAELKLAVGKEQGDKAFVGGYYTDGDGGGGDFYWDAVSVETDNGGTILQVTGTTTGRWKRIYSGSVNVKWFGAKGDGVTNDTPSIQSAITFATLTNNDVFISDATFVILTSLIIGRVKIFGVGAGSILKPLMTDGTPVILSTAGTAYISLKDFIINSGINSTDFIAGTINAQNCIGIKLDASGSSYTSRYHVKNVRVNGCQTGWVFEGFIGSIENAWSSHCEIGFTATEFNSVRLNWRNENNRKDFVIANSNGLHFDQYITQGGHHQSGILSSTIDNCDGVRFSSPYFEQSRNSPFIIFGGTTECKGIAIDGVSLAMADNVLNDYDVYPLAFDKVNGLEIAGFISTGSHHNTFSTTSNTKNIVDRSVPESLGQHSPNDNSTNLSRCLNYFPNPNFDMWLRGYPFLTITRAAISQETTLVRRGNNAIRLTLTAGQTNGYVSFVFSDSYLGVKLRGKAITLYAWIWIPNTSDYNPNELTLQKVQPYISLYTDGTGGTTVTGGTHQSVRGAWNLMRVSTTVPADATRIDCQCTMLMTTGTAAGTEYLVIDSMFLVEGSRSMDTHIINGTVQDSDINQVIAVGGKMIYKTATIPTDTDLVHETGDRIEYIAPTAGGFLGAVCVTAGSPGTWKTFGAITA